MLKQYLQKISDISNRGDAREESFYSALEYLLKQYAESTNRRNVHITTLPKKTEAGNPDFRIWDGKQRITGYIEAKPPTVEYLDQIETSPQLKRYLHTFPNLILTNFFEFRLYRNGTMIEKVTIARPFVMHKLKAVPSVENESDFFKLLGRFFSFSLPKVYDAKTLALELAKRTRFLRDEVITEELKNEQHQEKKFITGFYEAFRKYLISGLTKEEFADLYSQTVTYGLFAARTRFNPPNPPLTKGDPNPSIPPLAKGDPNPSIPPLAKGDPNPSIPPLAKGDEGGFNGFNRKLAYDMIPKTIGILRDVFKFISLEDLPQQMEWIIDDISEVLASTDVSNILHKYFHEGKGKDPIVHFYETFLAEYDPKTREKRGVYYTPEPVVSYIVRSLHKILQDHFNREDGLADSNVTVLDPAAGTLTFLAESARLAVDEISRYGEAIIETFIKEHILKNFYGFELMMAPYAIGHIKMSLLLEEFGYKLQKDERFKFYLTNTLEMKDLEQTELPGMASLSEESHLAGIVKKETPILVILGNPPYSGHSANVNEWIEKLLKEDTDGLQSFYKVDDKPLAEKNPKWLQDDYVKFIRFAQWKINKTGEGVLGFITNHSYIDNPTFRGMRQSLMKTFNEIYILNLHGSSLKKEKCPDDSKDENVFDIRQGVAIALFIKQQEKKPEALHPLIRPSPQKGLFEKEPPPEKPKKHKCTVHHAEIWGLREKKYDWLSNHDIENTKWKKLLPKSEYYLFIPREDKLFKIYEKYSKITDIFPINSVGVVTARDDFVIDADKEVLKRKIRMFIDEKLPDEIINQSFHLKDKSNWQLKIARENVRKLDDWQDSLVQILYRPFDERWIFYNEALVERTRREVMEHMKQDNLGLIFHKREELLLPYSHFLVTDTLVEHGCLSTKTTCYLAPLYIYLKKDTKETKKKKSSGGVVLMFEPEGEYSVTKPNLSSKLIDVLKNEYKKQSSPEQIFYYIYAVIYSNIYRSKYAEFLKIDFPRIPFTKNYKLFNKMADYGEQLVRLHLLEGVEHTKAAIKLQGKGTNKIEKVRYEKERLYINNDQYFEDMKTDIWEYYIGGYQVCEKWLKDRKDRTLSLDDMKHYCKIVTALQKTIAIQKQIDKIYTQVETATIEFSNE